MMAPLPPEQGPGPGHAGLLLTAAVFDVPSDPALCHPAQGDLKTSLQRE